jgi:hypothetical protein
MCRMMQITPTEQRPSSPVVDGDVDADDTHSARHSGRSAHATPGIVPLRLFHGRSHNHV